MTKPTSSTKRYGTTTTIFATGALLALALACSRRSATGEPPQIGTTELTSSAIADLPRGLVTVEVPGTTPSYLAGTPKGGAPRIVYLHGMCSGPEGLLPTFERAAREHGGVIGLTGDKACPDGNHSYTVEAGLQQERLERALEAATGGGSIPELPEIVIGYSQGATLAEKLAATNGYPFVVLIGSPRQPSPENLERARAVVMISGENDMAKPKMKAARDACEAAGIPAHYIEMPGAHHGELPDAENVIGEALAFLRDHAR